MIRGGGENTAAIDELYQEVRDSEAKSIAISAPRSGHGVTYLSLALAKRMAEAGISTLLVDLNLLNPGVHKDLGIELAEWWPGDEAAISEVRESAPNFHVLPASDFGGAHVAFHERAALQTVVHEWMQAYQCVILDCAPLLEEDRDGVAAELMMAIVDKGLLVVKSGASTQPDIQAAMRLLHDAGADMLGMVMNDIENPPLGDELQRQLDKVAPYAPKLTELAKKFVGQSILIKGDR